MMLPLVQGFLWSLATFLEVLAAAAGAWVVAAQIMILKMRPGLIL